MSPFVAGDGARQPAASTCRYLSLVPAAIVVAALYFGRPVLLPLAVGVLFAFALAPLVGRLRRIGVGRIPSVLVAAVLAIAVTGAVGVYITTRTIDLAGELPRYQTNLIEKIRSVRGSAMEGGAVERASNLLKTLRDQFMAKGTPLSRPQRTVAGEPANPVPVQIQQPEAEPIELAAAVVWPLFEFLLASGIVIIFMIFILLYKEDIRDRFIRLAGGQDIQKTTLLLDEGAERLGYYLLTQTAINAVFGLADRRRPVADRNTQPDAVGIGRGHPSIHPLCRHAARRLPAGDAGAERGSGLVDGDLRPCCCSS